MVEIGVGRDKLSAAKAVDCTHAGEGVNGQYMHRGPCMLVLLSLFEAMSVHLLGAMSICL